MRIDCLDIECRMVRFHRVAGDAAITIVKIKQSWSQMAILHPFRSYKNDVTFIRAREIKNCHLVTLAGLGYHLPKSL